MKNQLHFLLFLFTISGLLSCKNNKTQATVPIDSAEETWAFGFRPNIVWIVAEDMSPTLPPFEDSTITTPNLSRLAAEGIRYTHVFSSSGVCAPSRAAIATGMYQNHIGAHQMRTGPWYRPQQLPLSEATLANAKKSMPPEISPYEAVPPPEVKMHSEYLRRTGYYCTNNAKHDYQFQAPVTAWDETSAQAHWKNRKPGQPFFAIFNLGVTHESQIWARAADSLWVDQDLEVPVPPYLPDNEIGRQDVRRMYSNIKIMDKQVGDLLAELEADGLLDSTVIFWYTDHGGPLPRQKRLLYDSGLRLPLIVRFPDKRNAGEIDDQLVSFIDFKPTLLSLAGIEPPNYVDGRAFLGQYANTPKRQYIHGAADRFDEQYDMIRAVRDHKFKYLRNFYPEKSYYIPVAYREQMPVMQELLRMKDADELNEYQAQWFRSQKDPEELFDTENDPHELQNLADNPAYAGKLAELRKECHRWMEAIDDKGLIPEPEFIESIWPGKKRPETAIPEIKLEDGIATITCSTGGATIGYQVVSVGDDVEKVWAVYQKPISVQSGDTIKVVAHRIGYLPNEVAFVRK